MKSWANFLREIDYQRSIIEYIKIMFDKEYAVLSNFPKVEFDDEAVFNDNSDLISRMNAVCDVIIQGTKENFVLEREIPDKYRNLDWRELPSVVIDYCIECIDNDEDITIEKLKKSVQEANELNGENIYITTDDELSAIIEVSRFIADYKHNQELNDIVENTTAFQTTLKLIDNSSSSNIFRQSFINIVSLFDAYIFDYLKEYFFLNPTELENFLDGKIKVNYGLSEAIGFNDVGELKKDIIRKQFENRYLSDVMRKLRKFKSTLFENIEFEYLMEMIQRRNIHLHNGGYADKKYCDDFNMYNFNEEDYVYISDKYLVKVFNVFEAFLFNLNHQMPLQ